MGWRKGRPFSDEASRLRGNPTLLQRTEGTEEPCAGPRARAGTTASGQRCYFLNLDGRARVQLRPVQSPHLQPLDCPPSGEKSVFILKVQMKKQVLSLSPCPPACLPDELCILQEPQEFHSVWKLSSGPCGPRSTITEGRLYLTSSMLVS